MLSVIAFHIDHRLLPAGFVGVDVFFVISGYLISSHIMSEIRNKSFSIAEFYRRRIKRIAPAMFVVLGVTVLATQFLFRPEDAEATARAGLWSIISLANVFFWLYQDTSYFVTNSNELPLLHLWSLGVEEQFYVIWPLVLMTFYTATRSVGFGIAMTLVAASSFLFGQYYFSTDSSFVYYMLPARAGELLVGAIAAHHVVTSRTKELNQNLVLVMALAGFVLLVGSLFLIAEEDPFPGFQALPPTLGVALLILAGHYGNTWPTRFLAFKPIVWIGLISYSAYLWHWPLLAFLNYGGFEVTALTGCAVLVLTLLLAWLTYRFVEQPLRHSKQPLVPLALRQFVLPAVLLGVVIGLSLKSDGYAFHRLGGDYESRLLAVREDMRAPFQYDYVCQRTRAVAADLSDPDCVVGDSLSEEPKAILWGDSNASHFVGMVGAFAEEAGFRFRNIEFGSCPPLPFADTLELWVGVQHLEDCRQFNQLVWDELESYDTVIISASWTTYIYYSDADLVAAFERTLKELAARKRDVIVLGKAPVLGNYDRLCKEKAVGIRLINCEAPPVALGKNIVASNEALRVMAERYEGVFFYDVNGYLCPENRCPLFFKSGEPVYYDSNHLTINASWKLGRQIIEQDGVPEAFARIGRHGNLPR